MKGAIALRRSGFSLIELMLVLVLTGLLFSLTPPLFHKAFPTLKLKAATRDLAQEIRYVQQAAVVTGAESLMRFEIESNRYQSDLVNQGKVRQLPQGIRFGVDDSDASQAILVLRFYPDGSSSGGLIRLGNEVKSFVITVDWLTSRIEVINDLENDER